MSRVRPGDPAWPDETSWARLSSAVGGRSIKAGSPLSAVKTLGVALLDHLVIGREGLRLPTLDRWYDLVLPSTARADRR
jgi:hypothetical protein